MQISITIEGQRGLNWDKWMRIVKAVEALGFNGLYRSDHFVDEFPPDQDSLDLWTSLTWLAGNTDRLFFGPLVTPVSFRHPVHIARIARDLNDLSKGRLVLGVGAGWGGASREHEMFGFDLLDTAERFDRFDEGIEVISSLLKDDLPVDFNGKYYQLKQARLIPSPTYSGRLPLLIGGNGPRKLLPMVAKYADEWNAIYRTPAQFSKLNKRLNELLAANGRDPKSVKRSQMKGLIYGKDPLDFSKKAKDRTVNELVSSGLLAGTDSQIIEQLGELSESGVEQVMVQWTDIEDIDLLAQFSKYVLEKVK